LTLGVEPVLLVVAVLAATLFKDLKGPIADPAWRGLDARAEAATAAAWRFGGGGLRGTTTTLFTLGCF